MRNVLPHSQKFPIRDAIVALKRNKLNHQIYLLVNGLLDIDWLWCDSFQARPGRVPCWRSGTPWHNAFMSSHAWNYEPGLTLRVPIVFTHVIFHRPRNCHFLEKHSFYLKKTHVELQNPKNKLATLQDPSSRRCLIYTKIQQFYIYTIRKMSYFLARSYSSASGSQQFYNRWNNAPEYERCRFVSSIRIFQRFSRGKLKNYGSMMRRRVRTVITRAQTR